MLDLHFTPGVLSMDAGSLDRDLLRQVYGQGNFLLKNHGHHTRLKLSPYQAVELDLVEHCGGQHLFNCIRINCPLLLWGEEEPLLKTWRQFLQLITCTRDVLAPLFPADSGLVIPFHDPACFHDPRDCPGEGADAAPLLARIHELEGVPGCMRRPGNGAASAAAPALGSDMPFREPDYSEEDLLKYEACSPEVTAVSFLDRFGAGPSFIDPVIENAFLRMMESS